MKYSKKNLSFTQWKDFAWMLIFRTFFCFIFINLIFIFYRHNCGYSDSIFLCLHCSNYFTTWSESFVIFFLFTEACGFTVLRGWCRLEIYKSWMILMDLIKNNRKTLIKKICKNKVCFDEIEGGLSFQIATKH